MGTADHSETVRALDTPAARELAALASIFAQLQTVLRCCEILLAEGGTARDEVEREALWTTALLCYGRCFTGKGVTLREQDVTATGLQGEVLAWHRALQRMRKRFTDPAQDPRERFSVGVVQAADGAVAALAITSTPAPTLDETTVRQTGALALELSKRVDARMDEQQRRVLAAAAETARADLERLPLIEVAAATTGA